MMADVKIIPATDDNLKEMEGKFPEVNEEECWNYAHISAYEALKIMMDGAKDKKAILINGKTIAIFGVNHRDTNPKLGGVWMMVTTDFKKYGARLIVREAKKYLAEMFKGFTMIESWVYKKNKLTARWMKWCGFVPIHEYDIGVENQTFVNYRLYKDKLNGS